MATTLFFDGRTTAIPGAYTKIDATALEVPGLGSTGVVGAIGTSVGGVPYNAIANPLLDLQTARNDGKTRELFRDGELRDVAPFFFAPSKDDAIPGGAQQVIFVKVNPAARSNATFGNSDGDALIVTSRDYGFFTTQVNIEIAAGTSGGKLLTVRFEDIVELFDNIGSLAKFTLQYNGGAAGATTLAADATAGGFDLDFTRDDLGQDDLVTNSIVAGNVVSIISSNAADTMAITIFGLDTSNLPQSETLTLNGTGEVVGTSTWNLITGAVLATAAAGQVDVRDDGAADVIIVDILAATLREGSVVLDIPVASATLSLVADGATTKRVVLRGLNLTNQAQAEVITMNGTTPVVTTASWKRIQSIELLELEVARTVITSGVMINAPASSIPTTGKLKDRLDAESDFTMVITSGQTEFLLVDLDRAAAVDVKTPATGSFFAVLVDLVNVLTNTSGLVTATRGTPGTGATDNTVAPVFLDGGHEGDPTPGNEGVVTAAFVDYQAAIDLLKQVRVNTVWVDSNDDAVHAALDAHAVFMAGAGKSERDIVVGADTGETKAELLVRAVNLNSRHVRLCGQEVRRFNPEGVATFFNPSFQAAIIAGMQAGSPVGEPLTHKFVNVLGFRQSSSWNPADDGEDMIQGGVLVFEDVPNVGRRVLRNITTHLKDNNLAFVEASVNEALNVAVFQFRTEMERAVGRKGFSGTVNAAKGAATQILDTLTANEILVTYRNLAIELVTDALITRVEMAPVLPINFVPITVHVVTVRLAA